MKRAASLVLIALVAGCSDSSTPTAPTAPTPVASVPKAPSLAVGYLASTNVKYSEGQDVMTITNPVITAASDGQIAGNKATVEGGSSITMKGDFAITGIPACGFDMCIGATAAWVGWITPPSPQPDVFAQPNKTVYLNGWNGFVGGSFTWTTTVPVFPGDYAIGAAQNPFFVSPTARGLSGYSLEAAALPTKSYGSFLITVPDPSVAAKVVGTKGTNDWYTSDVAVSWDVIGVAVNFDTKTGCDPITITLDAASSTTTCKVDGWLKTEARFEKSKSVSIKRDATAPTVTVTGVTPNVNDQGWNRTDATVDWTCADATSGVTDASGSKAVSAEGTTDVDATCTDNAGNSAKKTQTVKIDKTAPTVKFVVTPAPNAAGWNKTDVLVEYFCEDALSGPIVPKVSRPVTEESGSKEIGAICLDNAGNIQRATQVVMLDKTPPTLSPTLPPGDILLNAVVAATPNASDALSDIATATCDPVITSAAGTFTINCTATDKAGNSASKSLTYTVKSPFTFSGFKAPVGTGWNTVNAGAAVPFEFSLGGNKGLDILAANSPSSRGIDCKTGALLLPSFSLPAISTGANLTYVAPYYAYTWKTDKGWTGTCRAFVLKLTDGVERTAKFKFSK